MFGRRKSKILGLIGILLFFCSYSFACGGCRDSYLGGQKATEGIAKYDNGENQISNEIEIINNIIKEEIIKREENNLKESKILVELKKDENLVYKKNNFLLFQNNQIQSIINSLKAQ